MKVIHSSYKQLQQSAETYLHVTKWLFRTLIKVQLMTRTCLQGQTNSSNSGKTWFWLLKVFSFRKLWPCRNVSLSLVKILMWEFLILSITKILLKRWNAQFNKSKRLVEHLSWVGDKLMTNLWKRILLSCLLGCRICLVTLRRPNLGTISVRLS